MPIDESTIAALRRELPGVDENLYLNHGYSGRSPVGVGERIAERQRRWQRIGPGSPLAAAEGWDGVEAARTAIAELTGTAREAVALTASTSAGLAIVMAGLPWEPGDELLTSDQEHVGLLTPVAAVASRWGVSVRKFPANAADPVCAISELLTPRTRLLAFSEVLFTSGRVMPVAEIARACREQGVLVLADGAQSAGVMPVRPLESGADFYAATCHKWLSGPEGTGCLLVAPEHLAHGTVHPTVVGYAAAGDRPGTLAQTAARYEGSTLNFADFSAVPVALDFLRRGGAAADRYDRILDLALQFRNRLRELRGARLLLEADEDQRSGLVSWTMEGQDPARVASRLLDEHGICIRTVPAPAALRASFHFFNTAEEVDRLAGALRMMK
jgi:L-cysteine/cystine lyase